MIERTMTFIEINTRKIKILTRQEEAEVIRLYHTANSEDTQIKYRNYLFECNHKLVCFLANKYAYNRQEYLDMCQEGSLGLYPALKKYKTSCGFRFSTYAGHWIRQHIRSYMSNHGRNVRVPIYVTEILGKSRAARRELSQKLDRAPTIEEVVDYLNDEEICENLTIEKLFEYESSKQAQASLDFKIGEDTTLGEVIEDTEIVAPDVEFDQKQIKTVIASSLEGLTPREERIIRLRFGLGTLKDHTLDEIGLILGMTKERIRQIEAIAFGKLMSGKNKYKLKSLL